MIETTPAEIIGTQSFSPLWQIQYPFISKQELKGAHSEVLGCSCGWAKSQH